MNRRGVCYDVGRVMWEQDWRPELSPEETRRELHIIRDDLHCNAVRICGQDLDRLMITGGRNLEAPQLQRERKDCRQPCWRDVVAFGWSKGTHVVNS